MVYYNLVRRLWHIGNWDGAPSSFTAAYCTPECAVIIQNPHGGRILAAATTRHGEGGEAGR